MTIEINTRPDQVNVTGALAPAHSIPRSVVKVGRFIWNMVEMPLSMVPGMIILRVLLSLVPASYAAAYKPGTILSDIAMTVSMSISMVLWMKVGGQRWRQGIEMASAMSAPVAVIVLLRLLGAASYWPWLIGLSHPAMGVGMLVYMVIRRKHAGKTRILLAKQQIVN